VTDSTGPSTGDKRRYVRGMFTAIAPRYDFLNHLLSLNIDRSWRRTAVRRLGWERAPDGLYLDFCAGTLDLAATLGNQPGFGGRVIGADFVHPMLTLGRGKSERVVPVAADALLLPFRDELFHGATVGFGVRNLEALDAGLHEAGRVLAPGARLVILEFATPRPGLLRTLYLAYFRYILPVIGRLVSKHRTAYTYLPESVLGFPEPAELARRVEQAGFDRVEWKTLTGGLVVVVSGTRRDGSDPGTTGSGASPWSQEGWEA